MQHVHEPLKRYEPKLNRVANVIYYDEVKDGMFVKYQDVKSLIHLIANEVRRVI